MLRLSDSRAGGWNRRFNEAPSPSCYWHFIPGLYVRVSDHGGAPGPIKTPAGFWRLGIYLTFTVNYQMKLRFLLFLLTPSSCWRRQLLLNSDFSENKPADVEMSCFLRWINGCLLPFPVSCVVGNTWKNLTVQKGKSFYIHKKLSEPRSLW